VTRTNVYSRCVTVRLEKPVATGSGTLAVAVSILLIVVTSNLLSLTQHQAALR
jgi:hypothetical protein